MHAAVWRKRPRALRDALPKAEGTRLLLSDRGAPAAHRHIAHLVQEHGPL
jgi:hypothetical protein